MANGHTDINNDILAVGVIDDAGKHFPRVEIRIALEEGIKTAIS